MDTSQGLSNDEAQKLLAQYGPNVLPEQPPPSGWVIFVSQLKSPLVYILIVAGIVTVFLGHVPDAIIIFLAVFINSILGFIQERRANNALYALKQLVNPTAEVVRNGQRQRIDASQIVPGDVVFLSPGSKIPADGELLFANRLYIDEAIITGESVPVVKAAGEPVFMGTTVSSGQAEIVIKLTGAKTKVGQIAEKIQEVREDTPLTKQIKIFSRRILILVIILAIIAFTIGVLRGIGYIDMFATVVALVVAAIPEGLLISLTVVLAIGMQRILKRRGLVRKLASAETLGSVTTICVDKTGTLTQSKMQVTDVIGNEKELAKQVVLANDLDDPLVVAIFEWGRKLVSDFITEHPRLDSIPFSSKDKFFVSLHRWSPTKNIILINGAPDVLLQWVDASPTEKREIEETINQLTSSGKRIIGFAQKEVPATKSTVSQRDAKSGLKWLGLLALSDPIRPTVKDALKQAQAAGIKIIVITGDYAKTSEFVLRQLELPVTKDEIITGDELEKLSTAELAKAVKKVRLFARTTPEQKLKIVEALKHNGEIVAMMGDGVNDAPAIHKADIGIVVNEASDVSRESADLVLLDSNFATVVAAVEEGRGIFDNLRKVILYLLSDAFAEIAIVIGSLLLGLPLPITAVQIVWINLVSDGLPNLALTVDPKRPGIMAEKPRPTHERLVNHWMWALIAIVSLSAAIIGLMVFESIYSQTGDLMLAQSWVFLTIGLSSIVYVFSVRTLTTPFWKNNIFANKWLWAAVLVAFGLQALPFLTENTRAFFGVSPITLRGWLFAMGLSVVVFMIVETFKFIYRRFFLSVNHKAA